MWTDVCIETVANPFRWQTKPWDEEIGLYYSRARYYEAGTGRFVGVDPLEPLANGNWYGFGKASPVDNSDSSGLWHPIGIAIGVGVVLIGGMIIIGTSKKAREKFWGWQRRNLTQKAGYLVQECFDACERFFCRQTPADFYSKDVCKILCRRAQFNYLQGGDFCFSPQEGYVGGDPGLGPIEDWTEDGDYPPFFD